jgi:hypothetical protein
MQGRLTEGEGSVQLTVDLLVLISSLVDAVTLALWLARQQRGCVSIYYSPAQAAEVSAAAVAAAAIIHQCKGAFILNKELKPTTKFDKKKYKVFCVCFSI